MLPDFRSKDALDLLELLAKHKVEYLLVGGVAVNYYGYTRSTGGLDIFFRIEEKNANHLFKALEEFFGGFVPAVSSPEDLLAPGTVVQFGISPNRIDLINEISGVTFEESWTKRVTEILRASEEFEVPLIGIESLLENKKKANRPKDQEDFQYLKALKEKKKGNI